MSTMPAEAMLGGAPVAIGDSSHKPTVTQRAAKTWLFWTAITLLMLPGLVHAYLLMPFPGSQNLEAITVSYYLEKIILPLRIAGLLLIGLYAFYFAAETRLKKIIHVGVFALCLAGYYFTDVAYSAQAMFKEPQTPRYANVFKNKVPTDYMVIGVVSNGVAKAYPITYIGYHHKIQDNVGNLPVLVTYCTMCRTGRVFSPIVNGKRETFRLVGARHYNAVIEDATTKTWWYQATGEAAVGERKGQKLNEIPSQQSTLAAWLEKYPSSLILQPESQFKEDYADLKNYDVVQPLDKDSTIKNKDTLVRKSWVVGIKLNNRAKAYDWRKLAKTQVANDALAGVPLLVALESDQQTFHAWNRTVDGKALHFMVPDGEQLVDRETGSVWNWDGLCTAGLNKGKQLTKIQAYQEYWHSWKNFHPGTTYTASF